jgi:ATP-dependent Lhr-like helicase
MATPTTPGPSSPSRNPRWTAAGAWRQYEWVDQSPQPSAKQDSSESGFTEKLSAVAREWFTTSFDSPTPAQLQAWEAIAAGEHALVIAPTGSGKTLAAFLWAIDQLLISKAADEPAIVGTSVIYVSPLKALAVDIEKNLRLPLAGIAELTGSPDPVNVGIRTGDTSPAERRRLVSHPPDILITTPESLFLMLTSAARSTFSEVTTVIVDEIHALASNKRGSHLALSLERLEQITRTPPQRIGLSATVRPPAAVAQFLVGARSVAIIEPESTKEIDLSVIVPVTDLSNPPSAVDREGNSSGPTIWPHVYRRITQAITEHRSTLVFANSRRLAERLTTQINEIWWESRTDESSESRSASQLARAHHGSVSKENRKEIEDDLKSGQLRAVVATSSLELGIDMGAVDLVIQVQSPPSVSSGLQRVGRAGHQVGATSRALIFPTHRGDLLASAVTVQSMGSGRLEPIRPPSNPLDVLAQQIVGIVAMDEVRDEDLFDLVTRAGPFLKLPRSSFDAVLDMLSGRYLSEDFAKLRPRLTWDRTTGLLTTRSGSQRLAVTSGGTIPDRGHFAVMLAGGDQSRRVGELDEEMVYESRVGDVFALGSAAWRIEEITTDRVLVTPAPGSAAKMPFWHGDALGRPAELGIEIGRFLRTFDESARTHGLDESSWRNLTEYLNEQMKSTGVLPSDRTVVIEQFTDEIGDRRVVIHSPLGARVLAPWALVITHKLQEKYGIDAQVMPADDGIVLRLPEESTSGLDDELVDGLFIEPAEVMSSVTRLVSNSALFASRFRECAARALMFGLKDPRRRSPLWQQRQRSAQLLAAAAKFESFPIVLETVREVLQDVYNVPELVRLMQQISDGHVSVIKAYSPHPSPMARSLLFGYVAQFMYEGDTPLAERKSAALSLDETLLAELLGTAELRELLDLESIRQVESRLQYVSDRATRSDDNAWDIIRVVGPLKDSECEARGIAAHRRVNLLDSRRVFEFHHANSNWLAVSQDAGLLRDALRIVPPTGVESAYLDPRPDPLLDLVHRYANCHGPFVTTDICERFQVGESDVVSRLEQLRDQGTVVRGAFHPEQTGTEWCQADVLRSIRRASAAAYAGQVEPIDPQTFAQFPTKWQPVGTAGSSTKVRGVEGLMSVIEVLAGTPLPASQLESMILASRVEDYSPTMLDELTTLGEVVWWGITSLPNSGWVGLAPAGVAPAYLKLPTDPSDELDRTIHEILLAGGGWFDHQIAERAPGNLSMDQVHESLWRLVWSGHITNDSIAPLRRLGSPRSKVRPHRRRQFGMRERRNTIPGRWSTLPDSAFGDPESAIVRAETMLRRHGIVVRGTVVAERAAFGPYYRALGAMEEKGRCRRGYFVAGLGGAQFGLATAIDLARSIELTSAPPTGPTRQSPGALVLAAADPGNPYGAALAWPESPTLSRPGRKDGAIVVLSESQPVVYHERGGANLLVWELPSAQLHCAAAALVEAVDNRIIPALNIKRINGQASIEHEFTEILASAGAYRTPSAIRIRPK